jgi:hypothetical protein
VHKLRAPPRKTIPTRPPNFGSIKPPSHAAPRQKPLANETPHSPNLDPQHPTHPAPPTEQTGDLNAASVQGLERCRLDESQQPTNAFPLLSSTKNTFSGLFRTRSKLNPRPTVGKKPKTGFSKSSCTADLQRDFWPSTLESVRSSAKQEASYPSLLTQRLRPARRHS